MQQNPEADLYGRVLSAELCAQDELVQALRSDGRRQAAQRMLRQKRDGTPGALDGRADSHSGSGE